MTRFRIHNEITRAQDDILAASSPAAMAAAIDRLLRWRGVERSLGLGEAAARAA